jgi:cytochrome d ubiquinol oxidase subunit II
MLETLIAAVMLASLIPYALMGGADYGGGMWDLLASGPKAQRQRHAIVDAIAPIWEANHVWLILVIVLLFTAFPRAFSVTMIALQIPITAMLIRIVLRGSAFVFRKYDSTEDAVQRRWSTIFGIASFFTPFFQGLTLGALTNRGHPFRRRSRYHRLLRGLAYAVCVDLWIIRAGALCVPGRQPI